MLRIPVSEPRTGFKRDIVKEFSLGLNALKHLRKLGVDLVCANVRVKNVQVLK